MMLALGVVALLFWANAAGHWVAFWATIVVIWLDGLDGYVARKLGESSAFGALWDILCDRVVEQVYWIAFAVLGWVPVWMALVVVVRGVLVDGLRSVAMEHGHTAFGSNSMMQHPVGIALVSSRASRWLYAVSKALAFCLVILCHTPGAPAFLMAWLPSVTTLLLWVTVFFCVIRGVPVLIEARRFFQ